VKLYEQTKDAGPTYRRCGISRPTLRKRSRRYQEQGEAGLRSQSRRPIGSPLKKADGQTEALILGLRKKRKPGPKRLRSELERRHAISLSASVIRKVLRRNDCKPPAKPPRKKAEYIRCRRPIPGERIQMDTCKIAPNLYRYTSIDDCTHYRVLQIYKKRTAGNTLDFLDRVLGELPFPAQRIQADRGMEFFAEKVQRRLYGARHKIPPQQALLPSP